MLKEKILPFVQKNIKWILIILGILILILTTSKIFKNKSGESNSTEIKTSTYSISSENTLSGNYQVEERVDGSIRVEYAMVITDSDLVRNGKCIDVEGSEWCDDAEHVSIESIGYRYTANLVNSNDPEELHATYLQAVYANKEALIADPQDTSISLWGDFAYLVWNERPKTDTFLIRNITTYDSLEDFLATDSIDIYSSVEEHKVKYTYDKSTYTGKFEQVNGTYEETVNRGDLVKTYEIEIEVIE